MRIVPVSFALSLAASAALAQSSFYNWETPPVHPVDMTPDGTKLLVTLAVTPASLPLRATLVIDVPTASTGQCGEATFPGPEPAPHCGLNGNGKTAFCR